MALPACVAVIEQVPAISSVMSDPLTVQTAGVVDVSVTGRPEDAVGVVVTGVWSSVLLPGLVNVIDWLTWFTVKARVIGVAAAYVPLPGCVAVIEHVPAATSVIWKPVTVQTGSVVDVRTTVRPDDAVGATVTGVWSMVLLPGLVKVMDCGRGTAGMTAFDGVEAGPVPTAFVAVTVNV